MTIIKFMACTLNEIILFMLYEFKILKMFNLAKSNFKTSTFTST
jgi:hypothetical protein